VSLLYFPTFGNHQDWHASTEGHPIIVRFFTDEELRQATENEELETIRDLYTRHRGSTVGFANLGLQGKVRKDVIENELIPLRGRIRQTWVEIQSKRKLKLVDTAQEIRPGVIATMRGASYVGVKGLALGGITELDMELAHMIREVHDPLEQAWDFVCDRTSEWMKSEIETAWNRLDYLLPLCIWRIPVDKASKFLD